MAALRLHTGYSLPFAVRHSRPPLLSNGFRVQVRGKLRQVGKDAPAALSEVLNLFEQLAVCGALGGNGRKEEPSSMHVGRPVFQSELQFSASMESCCVDECALVVLCHLFLARREQLDLEWLEFSTALDPPDLLLQKDRDEESSLPGVVANLPFRLIDENPESGGYTFSAELGRPIEEHHVETLESALSIWVECVLAGAYAMAPFAPEDSYVETDSDEVTSFNSTVEWTVYKVRADPACIRGVVNIFAAFDRRWQAVRSLTIS
jgi:hypothetical protein